jgi:hypothetical protein
MSTFKFIFLFISLISCVNALAQNDAKSEDVKSMVESKRFIFMARSATPVKSGIKQLTSDYTLKVTPDTIFSNLPYFGEVTQPLATPSDGGIKFTSTDFDYKIENRKKGGWEISIQIKDVRYNPRIDITIFETGSAYVSVNSNDRQPISYDGEIK